MNLQAIIALPRMLVVICASVLAGCVSYSGSNLVPGISTAADVEASMGKPAETRALAAGGGVWYYPRGPLGRHTYVVTLRADDVVASIEQRLTDEYFEQIVSGTSTMKQVRELLGPPNEAVRYDRLKRTVWEYRTLKVAERRLFYVEFSDDGVARLVVNKHDDRYENGPSISGKN